MFAMEPAKTCIKRSKLKCTFLVLAHSKTVKKTFYMRVCLIIIIIMIIIMTIIINLT